jgi:hypothetical protein
MEASEYPNTQAELLSLLFGGRQVGSLSEVRNGPHYKFHVPRLGKSLVTNDCLLTLYV